MALPGSFITVDYVEGMYLNFSMNKNRILISLRSLQFNI